MTRFTKTKKALRALTDTILGGSSNVVRTLKVAGHSTRDKEMLIMDYLDNMEEEYHKSYPDDPCPMDGGYKASFERFVIESIGAELDLPRETE